MQYHLAVSGVSWCFSGFRFAARANQPTRQLNPTQPHPTQPDSPQPVLIDFILLYCGLEFFSFHAHLANAGETFNLIIASFVGTVHSTFTPTHAHDASIVALTLTHKILRIMGVINVCRNVSKCAFVFI